MFSSWYLLLVVVHMHAQIDNKAVLSTIKGHAQLHVMSKDCNTAA